MGMKMKEALPFLGMIAVQFIQVGLIVAIKQATSRGMTKFVFVFYSNALASLVLLPTSFLIHRAARPPITLSLLGKFFLLGLFGFVSNVTGNAAIQITPVSFTTAMLNLIPAFTFILAVTFRMEEVDFRSPSTLAKTIGTLVSISGALVVTLYKGPSILMTPSQSNILHQLLLQPSNFFIGGMLLVIDCLAASAFTISQAIFLKKFGAELIIVFFYCFFVAIMSATAALVMERDSSAWSLQPTMKLLAVLYSGVIGSATQVGISTWCLHKRGPVFVAVFHPVGIVISAAVDVILGDTLYLGSLVGSIVIVIGFYFVMWGKAEERKATQDDGASSLASTNEKAPLLQESLLAQCMKETRV